MPKNEFEFKNVDGMELKDLNNILKRINEARDAIKITRRDYYMQKHLCEMARYDLERKKTKIRKTTDWDSIGIKLVKEKEDHISDLVDKDIRQLKLMEKKREKLSGDFSDATDEYRHWKKILEIAADINRNRSPVFGLRSLQSSSGGLFG